MTPTKVRFVCVSDTHNKAPGEGYTLPKGDVLVHAGDITNQGSYHELKRAAEWLQKADFAVKIVVAGNHDLSLDPEYTVPNAKEATIFNCRELMRSIPGVTYLQHESATVTMPGKDVSFRVFGSPYSTRHHSRFMAFQDPQKDAAARWSTIPEDVDILITHTPPAGMCDKSEHWSDGGCEALSLALWRVRPTLHVCGHCHEGRGAQVVSWSEDSGKPVGSVRVWKDPGVANKKQCLLDLAGGRGGQLLDKGSETAIVNAAIMMKSWSTGVRTFNKPILVDVVLGDNEV